MLSRRDFLGGLIASVAAAALFKNGVTQPEQVIAEPKRTVFDMAANTWRIARSETIDPYSVFGTHYDPDEFTLHSPWVVPEHNGRCVIVPVLREGSVRWGEEHKAWAEDHPVEFGQVILYVPDHLDNAIIGTAISEVNARHRSPSPFPNWRITAEEVQARIDELSRHTT